MFTKRSHSKLPRIKLEMASMAGLASIDLKINGGTLNNAEFIAKSTLGGVVVSTAYQALLTGLRSQAMVNKAQITKSMQIQLIFSSVSNSLKEGAAISLSLSCLLIVFPWLRLPLSILGLLGASKASIEVFNAFWGGLNEIQKAQLLNASREAGVNLIK